MSKTFPFVIFFYISSFLLFLCSNHWFLLWLSIELTTLMFIPMMNSKSKSFVEMIVMYFLIQAISSALLIFGFLQNQILLLESQIFNMCAIALLIKLAVAPLHSWFPPILAKMDMTPMLLMFTLQKFQPFLFLFLSNPKSKLMFLFIITTCMMGSISNMIQNNMKLILSYSSISHGGWLLMALWVNKSTWIFYTLTYFITIFMLWNTFISNLTQTFHKSNLKSYWSILLMSMAGIPPLMGFYPKMMILEELLSMTFFLMIFILLTSTTMDFFIYTRAFYMGFLNKVPTILWMSPNKKTSLKIFMMFSIFSLLIAL